MKYVCFEKRQFTNYFIWDKDFPSDKLLFGSLISQQTPTLAGIHEMLIEMLMWLIWPIEKNARSLTSVRADMVHAVLCILGMNIFGHTN